MEIGGIGDLGFNNIVNDGVINNAKNQANDVSRFEETLKRTASQMNQDKTGDITASEPLNPEPHSSSSKFAKIDKTDELYKQCVELEIFLVKTLVSSMRNTVQKSGLINEGYAGKMYEDMLYDEYAKDFAKNANFGMAEMAYLELTGQRGKQIR
ncbi:MAG: rod-binding protein [Treponema sp.]|jgi:flagellar protein FlgJ|nr:rod-binding protein [Treponema sp.]